MIKEPLVYFRNEAAFNASKRSSNNDKNIGTASANVVFIGTDDINQTGKIYTHGQYFGGTSNVTPEQLTDFLKSSDISYTNPVNPGSTHTEVFVGTLNVGQNTLPMRCYVPKSTGGEGATTLADLTDTNITNPQNRDVLMYQDGKWINYATGGGGDNPIVPPEYDSYDDEWIHNEVERINQEIEEAEGRLDAIHNWSEQEVNNAANNAIKNMSWYATLIDENGQIKYQGLMDNLVGVGAITETSGTWSTLRQKVTDAENGLASLEAEVANLEMSGTDPDTMATLIASRLGMSVEDWNGVKTATTKLESMWTTGTVDDTNKYKAAEWMLSAYRSAANQNKTFSEVISDASNAAVGSATAALATRIDTIEGQYVTTAEVTSKVNSAVNGAISSGGFVTKNTIGDALSYMYSHATSGTDGEIGKAAVFTHIADGSKSAVLEAINDSNSAIHGAIAGMVAEGPNPDTLAAVFVRNDALDGAVAGLLATDSSSSTKAKVIAAVKDGKSSLELMASDIKFSNDGKTVAAAIQDNAVAISNLNVGNLDATYAKIADLNAAKARIDALEATTIDTTRLHTFSGESKDADGHHIEIKDGYIYGYMQVTTDGGRVDKDPMFMLDNNGSGYLAQGKIYWNADGSGYIGGEDKFSWDANGNVFIDNLDTNTLSTKLLILDEIDADSIHAKTLHSYSGQTKESDGRHVVIEDGKISAYVKDGSTDNSYFVVNNNGSGRLGFAGASLSWSDTSVRAKNLSLENVWMGGDCSIDASGDSRNGQEGQGELWTLSSPTGYHLEGFKVENGDVFVTEGRLGSSAHGGRVIADRLLKSARLEIGNEATTENVAEIAGTLHVVYGNIVCENGDLYSHGGVVTSDRNLKDITSDVELTLDQIANAPAVNFTWKSEANKENKKEHVGTIAQYWEVVLPQAVSTAPDGSLAFNYGNAAMVSSIVTAKEVVALKEQIAELQRRLDELKNI